MNYELLVCRQKLDAKPQRLESLLENFKATKIRDLIYEFESDALRGELRHEAKQWLGGDYYFAIIGLDGTQDNPIPDVVEHNDGFIDHCDRELKGRDANIRYSLRIGIGLHFSRREDLLESPMDAQSH